MIQISSDSIADRFMRYVMIDTQSDPESTAHPTTEKQKDLRWSEIQLILM